MIPFGAVVKWSAKRKWGDAILLKKKSQKVVKALNIPAEGDSFDPSSIEKKKRKHKKGKKEKKEKKERRRESGGDAGSAEVPTGAASTASELTGLVPSAPIDKATTMDDLEKQILAISNSPVQVGFKIRCFVSSFLFEMF